MAGIGLLASMGLMWIAVWLLTGNWHPDFGWNEAGFINYVLKEAAVKKAAIYHPFEDDGGVSLLFAAGIFLTVIILTMLFTKLLYGKQAGGKGATEGFWCWYCCLIVILAFISLTNLDSVAQKWTADWNDRMKESFEDRKYSAEEDPVTLGRFERLDGFEQREEEALAVTMSKPQCCYLRGFVGEVYEADGWRLLNGDELTEDNGLFVQLYDMDFDNQMILGDAVSLTDGKASDAKSGFNEITVINKGTDSRYLYVPYEMCSLGVETEKRIGGAVLKAAKDGNNREYTLTATDYAEDEISKIKAQLKKLQGKNKENDFFLEEFNYRRFVTTRYLQISEEARLTLERFLGEKGAQKGNTDRLTAAQVKKKILKSLEPLRYEKDAVYRAEQGDFLTCFFDEKEGYSVHFATAAALLFRYYGIPARFAEGYLITPEDVKGMEKGETIHVEKADYHAWAEYYEEGVGWIPFEATPAYIGVMPGDLAITWQPEEGERQQNEQDQNAKTDQQINNMIIEETEINLWAAAKVILLLLLILILIAAVIWRLTHRRFDGFCKKDFKSKDCRRAILAMMAYMRKLGRKNNTLELISEPAQKLYEEARYSNHVMTEVQRKQMFQYMTEAISLKKKRKRRWPQKTAAFMLIIMLFTGLFTGCSEGDAYKTKLEETQKYLYEAVPEPACGSLGGEWVIIGMAQGEADVPDAYYEKYLKRAEAYVASKNGVLHTATGYKYTEYSRLILGITAAGGSPDHVGGYNLLEQLTHMDDVCRQGINGPIWALIAFDSGFYEIPRGTDDKKETSRVALIEAILDGQLQDGGWDIMETQADVDMTAMALQALAPYYTGDTRFTRLIGAELLNRIEKAVDSGLETLCAMQLDDGGFASWGNANAESCAQVVVALSSLGIDCEKDPRFVKKEGSVLKAMLSYQEDDGSFCHVSGDGGNLMATEQCCYALAAYDRFVCDKGRLYDFI